MTSLALLAFLGDGSTPKRGPHKAVVEKAVTWLVGTQTEAGSFGPRSTNSVPHALATMAVLETYELSKLEQLRPVLEKAVRHLVMLRNVDGAWGAREKSRDGEPLATATAIIGLWTAKQAGFAFAPDLLVEARKVLAAQVREQDRGDSQRPTAADAALMFVGVVTDEERLVVRQLGDLLLTGLPGADGVRRDFVYLVLGSHAMFQSGGRHWTQWRKHAQQALIGTQVSKGHANGSWDPTGVHGKDGGRVATTALGVLGLEVYYRYTRLIR